MFGFLLGALAAQAPAAAEPLGGIRHLYQNCPGQDVLERAANVEWGTPSSRIEAHRAFRAQLHVDMPEGAARILWYATGGDLATTTFSVVAVRRADGVWHVNGIGQTVAWIQGAKPTPMPRLDRDL